MSDLPAGIVAAAARLLYADRREWGEAMVRELSQLRDREARWQFALGCARAAVQAPMSPNHGSPGVAVTLIIIAGVLGCLAATAIVLAMWLHAVGEISRGLTVWFIGSLAAYLWIALHPPRVLVVYRDAARRGAGIGFGLFLVTAVGRTVIDAVVPPSNDDAILGLFLVVAVAGTFSATAFASARAEQSAGAGVTAALWAGLVCSILAFNADLFAILAGFQLEAHMRNVMPDYYTTLTPDAFMSRHIGGHLASSMEGLRTLPLLAFVIGIIGAALGRGRRAGSTLPLRARS